MTSNLERHLIEESGPAEAADLDSGVASDVGMFLAATENSEPVWLKQKGN